MPQEQAPHGGGPIPTSATAIAIVGCGYVGLVTAAGFAEQGHRVYAFDSDAERVQALRAGVMPLLEPGLAEACRAAAGRLTFHHTAVESCPPVAIVFLATPTPAGLDGQTDLRYLQSALRWLAASLAPDRAAPVVAIRSTAPPGATAWAEEELRRLGCGRVPVVANPEFLQEGQALTDFRRASRVLIGSDDDAATRRLAELYSFTGAPVVRTDPRTAELAKYAANAFLAMRISFANELAGLAEAQDADAAAMLEAIGLDPRIGSRYLRPGLGFGGGCLPKDLDALVARGDDVRAAMSVCRAVRDVNQAQRARLVETLTAAMGDLAGHRIALVGLTFKPHTNDLRDAPAVEIAGRLARAGAQVRGWDPAFAGQDMSAVLDFDVAPDLYDVLTGVHAAVLCTEWPEAVALDYRRAAAVMAGRTLLDGRYGWDPVAARGHGLRVVRIGGAPLPERERPLAPVR